MNTSAKKHLAKAKDYLAKGDEFYRKAKPEIEAAYAEGATQEAISRYLLKSQRWVSDVLAWDGRGTLYGSDTEARQLRQAKQVLRESTPAQVSDLIYSEPKIALNVAKAAQHHEQETVEKATAAQRSRAPGLTHRAGFNEVAGELLKMKRAYGNALSTIRDLDLSDDEAEALEEIVKEIHQIGDWFQSFLSSGSKGFDKDLEELLAEGR